MRRFQVAFTACGYWAMLLISARNNCVRAIALKRKSNVQICIHIVDISKILGIEELFLKLISSFFVFFSNLFPGPALIRTYLITIQQAKSDGWKSSTAAAIFFVA